MIIGVHTPEFEFEKKPANVERAIRDLGVTWPVVQDNDYAQWRAYGNRYWPAHYFIDAKGRVRYFHFGEGGYEEGERVIQALLKEAGCRDGRGRLQARAEAGSADPGDLPRLRAGAGVRLLPPALPDTAARYEPSRAPTTGSGPCGEAGPSRRSSPCPRARGSSSWASTPGTSSS